MMLILLYLLTAISSCEGELPNRSLNDFEGCIDNHMFKSFDVTFPVNNSLMPLFYSIRSSAVVFDVTEVTPKNNELFLCFDLAYTGGNYSKCSVTMSEETIVDAAVLFPKLKNEFIPVVLSVRLCSSMSICFCQSTLSLLCCFDNSAEIESSGYTSKEKNDIKFQSFKKWEQVYTQMINLYNVSIPVESFGCIHPHGNQIKYEFIIAVKSFALNVEKRMSIRETWLHYQSYYYDNHRFCMVFIIGKTFNESFDRLLNFENSIFQDMLLGGDTEIPVIDSYYTLTEKVQLFYRWLYQYSFPTLRQTPSVSRLRFKYVVVCDDDVYVNITQLFVHLATAPTTGYYAGEVSSPGYHLI